MADPKNRWPHNAPGAFYVDSQCLDHDCCATIAPEHFRRNDAGGHYYVFKQPSTPEEYSKCMDALEACPVCAIGCDGKKSWWRIWQIGRSNR